MEQHHDGHAEVWEAVGMDCTSVAVAHSSESLVKRLSALGYIAPSVNAFGARWTHPTERECIVVHSQAFYPVKNECWVCNRMFVEARQKK